MPKKILFLLLLAISSTGFAQSNVGELTQQGGKKLSKEELQQLHAGGVTYKGALTNGGTFTEQHKTDGSVSGSAQTPRGSSGLTGTWTINDEGRLCTVVTIVANGNKLDACRVIWKQGDKYFSSDGDAPATAVISRQFEK